MNQTLALGLKLMMYGLAGVFTTLIGFIVMIVALVKAFPYKPEEKQ